MTYENLYFYYFVLVFGGGLGCTVIETFFVSKGTNLAPPDDHGGVTNLAGQASLFPNPTTGEFTIQVDLVQSETIDIIVTDIVGNKYFFCPVTFERLWSLKNVVDVTFLALCKKCSLRRTNLRLPTMKGNLPTATIFARARALDATCVLKYFRVPAKLD